MPNISFDVKYIIGQEVYMRTDTEGLPHLVVGYVVNAGHTVSYILESHGVEICVDEFQIIPSKRLDGIEYN